MTGSRPQARNSIKKGVALGLLALVGAVGIVMIAFEPLVTDSATGSRGVAPRSAPAPQHLMADAVDTYDRLWSLADRFYGADGQPPPLFGESQSLSLGSMRVESGQGGIRTVVAKPWEIQALAGETGRPGASREAQKSLLHEWAHVYQSSEVLGAADPMVREYEASQFARTLAIGIVRPKGMRVMPAPGALDLSQFGSNYGANPQTIIWPS